MPYGIKNETPKQTAWMEKCISSIKGTNKRTGNPYTKSEKIAICKVQLKKTKESEYDESVSEESLRELEEKFNKALSPDSIHPEYPTSTWLVDVYDDYVIVSKGDKYYRVPYSMSGDDVSFDWNLAVEVVRKTTYDVASENNWIERSVYVKRTSRKITDGYRRIS